ncbi:mechanosensitive ion channel domain-containing protein [Maridesulfovibrio sp.]|uniref:mechanosensitive ion channel domain-containing protein n=1 Tax=Maridesulfovibrio sp. TaxID=2795000 RepID=UPI0029F55AD1|nr:mechanosensitive ion channel domain-containing protein [Maridesulfovibrio sp.]
MRSKTIRTLPVIFALSSFLMLMPIKGIAQTETIAATLEKAQTADIQSDTKADTLANLLQYKSELEKQIKKVKNELKKTSHPMDKETLTLRLTDLIAQLNEVSQNFVKVATGMDLSVFNENSQHNFVWQEEIETLVRPLLQELKEMTKRPRQIERLKSRVAYFESRLPRAKEAVENISTLINEAKSPALKAELEVLKTEFEKRQINIDNQLDVAQFELAELTKDKQSFYESTKKVMAVFFKSRGKNILFAILAFAGVFFFFRFVDRLFKKSHPAFKSKERPFYVRLIEVILLIFTVIAATSASLFTLYISGDWFLLSLAIIFIIGALWTAREGFTRYYEQVKLILNLGSVRENERIIYNGVPWQVERIALYAKLKNPALSPSKIRLPIGKLENIVSRPIGKSEPWFPCMIDDWVILSDGVRGKVISQSPDMVELIQRGGTYVTYQTSSFLSRNPKNLSRNFRLKSVFGIDYSHQAESTSTILAQAKEFISARLDEEGYTKHVLNLNVEFESAAASSLNIVIIADFHRDIAELYGRLQRALQRYSVDACTHYGWGIPFNQLVIHNPE